VLLGCANNGNGLRRLLIEFWTRAHAEHPSARHVDQARERERERECICHLRSALHGDVLRPQPLLYDT
jgi:hypothetical protein